MFIQFSEYGFKDSKFYNIINCNSKYWGKSMLAEII